VTGQIFKGIGNSQNPGFNENILPIDNLGESGTVVTLSMLQGGISDGLGEIDFF